MAGNQVGLEIALDAKQALNDLRNFQSQSAESLKKISDSFGTLKAVGAAALGFLAVDKVKGFFEDSIKAAAEQEQGLKKLATAMQLTGEYSTEAIDDFSNFADEMQKTTKYGDELVISQLGIAKSLGLTNDKAKDLVTVSGDLASAMGETLDGALQQLGKTLSGSTGRLSQTFPALKQFTEEQLKAGAAVDFFRERFSGSATEEIKTYAGAVHQSDNAFQDFQKAIGNLITSSPVVIQMIQNSAKTFQNLQQFVIDNKDAIQGFINFGIKAISTAVPAAVGGLVALAKGFTALAEGALLAYTGVVEAAGGIADALGFDQVSASMANASAKAHALLITISDGVEKAAKVADSLQKSVDESAQAIFNADQKVAKSGEDSSARRSTAIQRNFKDAAQLKKELEDFAKFEEHLRSSQEDPAKKAAEEFQKSIEKIDQYIKKGTVSFQQGEELKTIAASTFADKNIKIHEEAVKRAEEAALAARNKIAEIASQPLEFIVTKLTVDNEALKKFRDSISGSISENVATGAGILNKVLDGASGAKSLIAEGAGAFADTLIPGIGGVVGSIVSKLAEGPDAVKAFVKQFVEAIPDIMTAIAESMPVVVEVFVDTMVNRGGAVRIGLAIIKAMSGEAWLKSIGKQIGIHAGDAFNADHIGRTIGVGFHQASAWLEQAPQEIGKAFTAGITGMLDAAQHAGDSIRVAAAELPGQIEAGFKQGGVAAAASITEGFAAGAAYISDQFDRLVSGFKDTLKAFNFPEIPTPGWLQDFIDAINKANPTAGGGGGGYATQVYHKVLGHASGITTIPSGYPNDSYMAGLSSGERVVDADTNSDLKRYLANGGNSRDVMVMLAKVVDLLSRPMTVSTTAKVDQKAFADIILSLNRTNQRLA